MRDDASSSLKEKAQRHRDKMASNSRDNYDSVAEIGAIKPVGNPERRTRCENDLAQFLVEYFPGTTGLSPFSDDHKRVIARLQEAALKGGRYFNLVFRGFAKTTISVNTCIWAVAYGHRALVVLIGANRNAAKDLLDAIKAELETNELLAEDFPEICQAIAALEGKNQRCASQTCEGELTHIEWTKDKIVFPTIAGSVSSGAAIVTRGITSSIRGIGQRRADGTQQRPDLVICDDLQTDQSAASPVQVRKRLMTLSKSILKLAGHNSTIACVVNGTIIERDDLMDRLRDPLQYPGWQGETVQMMRSPSNAHETLWLGDYARLRRSFDPKQPGDQDRAQDEANQFYAAHRAEMDAGCVVAWEHCYDHELELSAIQHAYNFLIDDGPEVFAAECQSEPLRGETELEQLIAADVIHKLSGYKHREVPPDTVRITCFIDCQDESFWYVVVSWTANYTGYVIDYGCWPDAKSRDASKKTLKKTLAKAYPDFKNKETRWRAGLFDLCEQLLGRDWLDPDGKPHAIQYAFVDVADGDSSLPIRSWVKASKWSKILRCSMGLGLRPADTPLGERKKADDELRRGLNWCEKRDKKVRGGSITWIDTNWWKSFVSNRWRVGSPRPKEDKGYRANEPGALYLYGVDAHTHQTFGVHQTSEARTRLTHEKSGRTIDFWSLKPNRPDNEYFDGLVGCAVLADMAGGVSLKDSGLKSVAKPQRRGPRKATPL
ncbi:terminase gpA endonuclease subunit [Schlesneria sp. DSM 10557]|uniref:terminase gpA endonuclease subunit n=1 Tax=Schlesneria sp. DSM 10557 TaxID=3044399 RepID=UPI0035A1A23C